MAKLPGSKGKDLFIIPAPEPGKRMGGRRIGRWGSPGTPRKVGPVKPPKGRVGPGEVKTTGMQTLSKKKK